MHPPTGEISRSNIPPLFTQSSLSHLPHGLCLWRWTLSCRCGRMEGEEGTGGCFCRPTSCRNQLQSTVLSCSRSLCFNRENLLKAGSVSPRHVREIQSFQTRADMWGNHHSQQMALYWPQISKVTGCGALTPTRRTTRRLPNSAPSLCLSRPWHTGCPSPKTSLWLPPWLPLAHRAPVFAVRARAASFCHPLFVVTSSLVCF